MKTFLKIILALVVMGAVLWVCPAVLAPLVVVGALTWLLVALGISALTLAAAVVLVVAAALSPLWVPVVLASGCVWLACKLCRRKA